MRDAIGDAWTAVESALPDGWVIETNDAVGAFGFSAVSPEGRIAAILVEGPTLLAALQELARVLADNDGAGTDQE